MTRDRENPLSRSPDEVPGEVRKPEKPLPAWAEPRHWSGLVSDQPVSAEGDVKFRFEAFARTLAELALNRDNGTPFTVVVKGEWGRGKTTLLRATKRILDEYKPSKGDSGTRVRKVKSLWFNAWKYPDSDTVLAGLLGTLLDEFREGDALVRLKGWIKEYKGAALWMLLQTLTKLRWDLEIGDRPRGRYSDAESKRAFYDEFERLFRELSHLLLPAPTGRNSRKAGGKVSDGRQVIAVFLDDLDRCSDERIVETLRAITLFHDSSGTCFYLGLDWEKVRSVMHKATNAREEDYLEKIFQVSVELPSVPTEGAEEYLRHLVTQTASTGPLHAKDVESIAKALRKRDPRHVKRFLNDLSLRLGILRNAGYLIPDDQVDADGVTLLPGEAAGALGAVDVESVTRAQVVAWHVLAERLEYEAWQKLVQDYASFKPFQNAYSFAREKMNEEGGEMRRPDGANEAHFAVYSRPELRPHMDVLSKLTREQVQSLMHLGSPPRPEALVPKTELVGAAAGTSAATGTLTADGEGSTPSRHPVGELDAMFDRESSWWVPLAGGEFTIGSADVEGATPTKVKVDDFSISRFPVTNRQYAHFVEATKHRAPGHWKKGIVPEGREDHPVVRVSWDDARKFCEWLSPRIGTGAVDLPTEKEWEYAARGLEGRHYPWKVGEPSAELANYGNTVGTTTPVGSYLKGATPEGVHDLAGNVWEWCRNWYAPYPLPDDPDDKGTGNGWFRVLRGGSFDHDADNLRAAFRDGRPPGVDDLGVGFRCVWRSAGGQYGP